MTVLKTIALEFGTFEATGDGASVAVRGLFNATLFDGVGTAKLQKKYDKDATWYDVSRDSAGNLASYTTSAGAGISVVVEEPEDGVLYRWSCTAYTSGSIAWRISQ